MNFELISFIWMAYTIPFFGIIYGLCTIGSIWSTYQLIKKQDYRFVPLMIMGIVCLLILEAILEQLVGKTPLASMATCQLLFGNMFFCLFLQIPQMFN